MAVDLTAKVKALQRDPTHIRNIAICAHIDHGKCVAGGSEIVLADGRILTAGELYDLSAEGRKVFDEDGKVIFDVSDFGLEVFSLNREVNKLERKKISHAWKMEGGEIVRLGLRNGYSIKTTPEHRYVVFENFGFKDKEAREIKIGDRIICPRKLNINCDFDIKSFVLKRMVKENFYVYLNEDFGEKMKKRILDYGIDELCGKIGCEMKSKSFYHGLWKGRFRVGDVIEICRIFDVGVDELYDGIESICYRNGKHRGKNSLRMKLPTNFEDFFYLAGLMFGDGSHHKFVVGKEDLGKRFEEICKGLEISVTHRDYNYRTKEITTSETLVRLLNCLFGYPLKRKSYNISVGEILWRADKKFVSKFVRGYFDTDGCVENSRRAVSIVSVSEKMLKGLQMLLLRFGCVSNLQNGNLFISGNSAKEFEKEIGFGVLNKSEKLSRLVSTIKGSYVCDSISVSRGQKRVVDCGGGMSCYNKEEQVLLRQLLSEFSFIEVKSLESGYEDVVYDFSVPGNRNFVAEGMIIHNTTFSDNLLAGAGMMSEALAGKARTLDFHEDEAERGITIDSASVSMVHSFEGADYLINLIDTPGHVDFGGDVTRAMRAVDGAIVLCCASEGIMPQTETVLRQALKERVKPILFINKVDRLIREVKLTPEEMQKRFVNIINSVNKLIAEIAEPEYKQKWQVGVADGSVAFGSAFHNWALSIPYMQKKGISFKEIIEAYEKGDENYKELAKRAPIHEVILNMVIRNHPNPVEAQGYRIPKIWHGDIESQVGQDLKKCNIDGEVAFVPIKIVIDPHAGEVAAGRLFSGKIRQGDELYMNIAGTKVRAQQVSIYKGAHRVAMDEVVAGNVVGIVGLKDVVVGETVSKNPIEPFEAISHLFEPVVTKSIAAKRTADLPKLVEILRQVGKEDPSLRIEINEETGESLMSGMGELHLEIIENRIKSEKGLEVVMGPPIVVFRESVVKKSDVAVGRTPNKHNDFFVTVEPLEESVVNAIADGTLPTGRMKKKDKTLDETLVSLGVKRDEAQQYRDIYKGCVFLDRTKGIVQIGEVIELLLDAFEQVMDAGPLAREPCHKMKVSVVDMKLHEDAIHRGPAQVYPAVRDAIKEAFAKAVPAIYEPVQVHQIEAPVSFMGAVTSLISQKRGTLVDVQQDETGVTIRAEIPVQEMIGWTSDLRSATEGRGVSSLVSQSFKRLPSELQVKVISRIRERKGLSENQ